MDDQLIETIEAGVGTICLNRPKVYNALSYELIDALRRAVGRLAENPDVRVVVLTGAGQAFCAGGDINDMKARPALGLRADKFEEDCAWARLGMETSRILYEMSKPTVALLPGTAAGAGLALALACDFRIAVVGAKLTTAFARIGLSSDFGASYFLTHLVGPAKARELLFLSETLTSDQAVEMGLVHRTVPRELLEAEGARWTNRLAELPSHAIGLMKANLRAAQHLTLSETLDVEAANLVRTLGHADFQSALARFLAAR